MNYTPLHTHSIYSIRDAVAKIEDYIDVAQKFGMKSFALTDHGTMAGTLLFYKKAKAAGIKPILGAELYVANRSRFDKVKGIDKYHHILLLATNKTGWKNLNSLIYESWDSESFYLRPRIDRELLSMHSEGLICTSACIGGFVANQIKFKKNIEVPQFYQNAIKSNIEDGTEYQFLEETPDDVVQWYKNIFGDRFYLEVQKHNLGEVENVINNEIIRLSKKYGVKIIQTGDTHFVKEEDRKLHNIMLATRSNTTFKIKSEKELAYKGDNYYLLPYEEMVNMFSESKIYLENTNEIAERCNIEFEFNNFKLPEIKSEEEIDDYLAEITFEGLKERYGNLTDEIVERAKFELDTIFKMNVSNYFLIIKNFIDWSKQQNIPIGIARGSAGGSIVSYALGIVGIDPLKYNLMFSRFLNKGRASYPIIDFDEYPLEKWSKNEL